LAGWLVGYFFFKTVYVTTSTGCHVTQL